MRFRHRSQVLLSVLISVGCSGSTGGAGPGGAAGAQSVSGAPSTAGAPSGGGGASGGSTGGAVGTSGSAGSAGSAATVAGAAGIGGTAGSASAGASQGGGGGSVAGTPFTCTMIFGLFTTSQWFNGTNPGGASKTFLQDGVDATRWEAKMQKYSYAEKWADPKSDLWDLAVQNPCAASSTTPDRAMFVGFSPSTKDQPGWEKLLNSVIMNIQTKYPSVKEIEILTMGRAPNNMLCSNNNDTDTIIAPYEDAAFQAVADASNGLVHVGPKYYVPDCENSYIFANDTDYTTSAANYIATEVATYYVAHP